MKNLLAHFSTRSVTNLGRTLWRFPAVSRIEAAGFVVADEYREAVSSGPRELSGGRPDLFHRPARVSPRTLTAWSVAASYPLLPSRPRGQRWRTPGLREKETARRNGAGCATPQFAAA